MTDWINPNDKLPEQGQFVLAKNDKAEFQVKYKGSPHEVYTWLVSERLVEGDPSGFHKVDTTYLPLGTVTGWKHLPFTGKIQILVECQVGNCAGEDSQPLDLVRELNGQPICQGCYGNVKEESMPRWASLPPVRLEDLKA